MNTTLKSIVLITRPVNVVLTFLSVWLAAFISPGFTVNLTVLWAALSASMILAGANVINDFYDFEIDKINRPQRPLVAGYLSHKQCRILFGLLYGLGICFSLLGGLQFFYIAVLMALLLVWYSSHLKRTVLWGNLVVSMAGGLTFIYGALAVDDFQAGIIPALFAFLFHFGREVLKDMQDVPGDLSNGVFTLPGRFGMRAAIITINIVFLVLIVLTLLPYIFSIYSTAYLLLVLGGVDTLLVFVMVSLWMRQDQAFLGKVSSILKVDMFIGLIAIWIGARHVIFFN